MLYKVHTLHHKKKKCTDSICWSRSSFINNIKLRLVFLLCYARYSVLYLDYFVFHKLCVFVYFVCWFYESKNVNPTFQWIRNVQCCKNVKREIHLWIQSLSIVNVYRTYRLYMNSLSHALYVYVDQSLWAIHCLSCVVFPSCFHLFASVI